MADVQRQDRAGIQAPYHDHVGPTAFRFEATHYVWPELTTNGAAAGLTPVMLVDRWAYTERSWNAGRAPDYAAAWTGWRDRGGARVQQRLLDPKREGRFAWETQPHLYRGWFLPHERLPKPEFLITHWVQDMPNAPREEVMAIDGVAYTRGAWDWHEPPEFAVDRDGGLREYPDGAKLSAEIGVEALPARYAGWLNADGAAQLALVEASGVRLLGGLPWGVAGGVKGSDERTRLAAVLVSDAAAGTDGVVRAETTAAVAERLRGLSPVGPWYLSCDTVRAWIADPPGRHTPSTPLSELHPFIPTHDLIGYLSTGGQRVGIPVMVLFNRHEGRLLAYDHPTWRTGTREAWQRGEVPAWAELDTRLATWRRRGPGGDAPICSVESYPERLLGWTAPDNVRHVFRCAEDGLVEVAPRHQPLDWTTVDGRAALAEYAAGRAGVDTAAQRWRLLAIDAEVANLDGFFWVRPLGEIQRWADVPPAVAAPRRDLTGATARHASPQPPLAVDVHPSAAVDLGLLP